MRHRTNWPAIHEWAQFYGKSITGCWRIMVNDYRVGYPGHISPWWSTAYAQQRMLRAQRGFVREVKASARETVKRILRTFGRVTV